MINYKIDSVTTQVRQWFFPDGCVGINVNAFDRDLNAELVTVRITFGDSDEKGRKFSINDDLIALCQTVDALKTLYPYADFALDMPYIPYARQDRACSPGDAFSLRVLGQIINSLGFSVVTVVDPHSNVAQACIRNMHVITQVDIFKNVREFAGVHIVAPDAGARAKAEAFAKAVGAAGVVTCDKKREMSTGKIIGFKVLDNVDASGSYFVLDDICDGGRTFLEVATAISEACGRRHVREIELAVTHGLFTQGTEKLEELYDVIYTTDSFNSNKDACIVTKLK